MNKSSPLIACDRTWHAKESELILTVIHSSQVRKVKKTQLSVFGFRSMLKQAIQEAF